MEKKDKAERQLMGCGYEPAIEHCEPWNAGRIEQRDERDLETGKLHLPVCLGYACSLPEVIEATQAHFFLKNGGLLQFCDGEQPTPALRDAVLQLESAYGAVLHHKAKQLEKGSKP